MGFTESIDGAEDENPCVNDEHSVGCGLGQATSITRLTIRWPDGSQAEVPNLAAGSIYTIQQGAGVVRSEPLRPRL
ncbi:MAG: ASPIC/UnbV domain-containing protein [Planctomycetota bacterium]